MCALSFAGRVRPASLAALLLACARMAAAADAPPAGPLSLRDVLDLSASLNAEVRIAAERIVEASAAVTTARSRLLPSVDGSLTVMRHKRESSALGLTSLPIPVDRSIGPNTVLNPRLTARAPVVDRPAWQDLQAVKADEERVRLECDASREEAMGLGASAYFRVLADRQAVELARESLARRRALVTLAADRLAAGVGTELEARDARAREAGAGATLRAAEARLAGDLAELKRLLSFDYRRTVDCAGDFVFAPVDATAVETAVRTAVDRRADCRAARQREETARRLLRSARAGLYPTVDLTGQYGMSGEEEDDLGRVWSFGFEVVVPIWDSRRREGRVRQAASRLEQARQETEALRTSVSAEIEGARENLEYADRRVRAARETVGYAEAKVAREKDRERIGTGTPLDTLNAEMEAADARFEESEALRAHNDARVAWFRALGDVRAILPAGKQTVTEATTRPAP